MSIAGDDLSFDFGTVDAQPARDPWLERRDGGIGASDVPILLHGFGVKVYEDPPDYIVNKSRLFKSAVGPVPRLVLEKAGLKAPLKAGSSVKQAGNNRERELCLAWKRRLLRGEGEPFEGLLDPASIRHADSVPKEWFPLISRACPVLGVTPDSWARDVFGALWAIEFKTSVHEVTGLRPWHADQVQAQMSAVPFEAGAVVCGEFWAAHWRPDGPIHAWPVHRDEALIRTIREVCERAWELVQRLKESPK